MIKSNLLREAGKYILSTVLAVGLSYNTAEAAPKGTQWYLDNLKIIGIDGFKKTFKNEVFVAGRIINYGNNTFAGIISKVTDDKKKRLEKIISLFKGEVKTIKYNKITYNQDNLNEFYAQLRANIRIKNELIEVSLTSKEESINIKKIEIIKPKEEEKSKENEIKIPKLETIVAPPLEIVQVKEVEQKNKFAKFFPDILILAAEKEKSKVHNLYGVDLTPNSGNILSRVKDYINGRKVLSYEFNKEKIDEIEFFKRLKKGKKTEGDILKITFYPDLNLSTKKEVNSADAKTESYEITNWTEDSKQYMVINLGNGKLGFVPKKNYVEISSKDFCKNAKESGVINDPLNKKTKKAINCLDDLNFNKVIEESLEE